MRYGTVCSGIEAPTIGWEPLGWKAQWFSEIAAFPSAVLAHHYPNVPNLGDMTKLLDHAPAPIDLLCGGTPCQDFSIAGLREGLDGDRGNLALEFCRIADRMRPRWVVWENVPGVLSSNGGRDFGAIVGALVKIGYGVAWRVLDAQYFGLAQRRKRVFLIGCLGGWSYSSAVLFEREGLCWSSPPSRQKGKGITHPVAPCLTSKGPGTGRVGEGRGQDPIVAQVSKTLLSTSSGYRLDDQETLIPDVAPTLCAEGKGAGSLTGNMATAGGLIYSSQQITSPNNRSNPKSGDPAPTLTAKEVGDYLVRGGVRRLMPIECERLQGFPEDFTQVPYRGKPTCKDAPRYEALGNSMATNVLEWLGERISFVDSLLN